MEEKFEEQIKKLCLLAGNYLKSVFLLFFRPFKTFLNISLGLKKQFPRLTFVLITLFPFSLFLRFAYETFGSIRKILEIFIAANIQILHSDQGAINKYDDMVRQVQMLYGNVFDREITFSYILDTCLPVFLMAILLLYGCCTLLVFFNNSKYKKERVEDFVFYLFSYQFLNWIFGIIAFYFLISKNVLNFAVDFIVMVAVILFGLIPIVLIIKFFPHGEAKTRIGKALLVFSNLGIFFIVPLFFYLSAFELRILFPIKEIKVEKNRSLDLSLPPKFLNFYARNDGEAYATVNFVLDNQMEEEVYLSKNDPVTVNFFDEKNKRDISCGLKLLSFRDEPSGLIMIKPNEKKMFVGAFRIPLKDLVQSDFLIKLNDNDFSMGFQPPPFGMDQNQTFEGEVLSHHNYMNAGVELTLTTAGGQNLIATKGYKEIYKEGWEI